MGYAEYEFTEGTVSFQIDDTCYADSAVELVKKMAAVSRMLAH